jgi:hypothetical protein
MSETVDTFGILGNARFQLVFRPATTLVIIGVLLWAVSQPYMEFSDTGPLILAALVAFAVWELVKMSKWLNYKITITQDGIEARNIFIRWDEVQSATAKAASYFSTFIEINGANGSNIKIPASIEQSAYVLSVCEKNIPNLKKEGV